MQPGTQQVRQASGARPGGTSLEAETEAVLLGLRLVPGGAVARLYSDLELGTLLQILHGAEGVAARAHLRDLWVHAVARNSNRHHQDMHHVARAAELDPREYRTVPEGAELANAVLAVQGVAQVNPADAALSLREAEHLPGFARPLQVTLRDVTFQSAPSRQIEATLTLVLPQVRGRGWTQEEALRAALERGLRPLARGGLVDLAVQDRWTQAARQATDELGVVRVRPVQASDTGGASH